jgi:hypothetical protein
MNSIFHENFDEFIIIYTDDILVYSKFTKEHVTHLKFVLQKFKKKSYMPIGQITSLQVLRWTSWDMCYLGKGRGLTQRQFNQLKNGKAQI